MSMFSFNSDCLRHRSAVGDGNSDSERCGGLYSRWRWWKLRFCYLLA